MAGDTAGGPYHFDPIELLGSRIPFVDPFSYDDRDFQASSSIFTVSENEKESRFRSDGKQTGYNATACVSLSRHDASGAAGGDLSLFDPVALKGSRIPVMLDYNNREFTMVDREPLVPKHCIQHAATVLGPNTHPGLVSGRVRLKADQAVHIFNQRSTKTKHTAALLAAEYGITPKAIRDIWNKKSWSQDTRPYWTHLDV